MFGTKYFLLLTIASYMVQGDEGGYNYDKQGNDWKGVCQSGRSQSPIALQLQLQLQSIPAIQFHNFDVPLRGALNIVNNGHTANIALPETTNGKRAYINGGLLPGDFEVQSVHFHWGSRNSKGSEHTINGVRYDVEVHVVCKNTKYATTEEATQHADGLAVLGIMLRSVPRGPTREGLDKIINQLSNIRQYQSSANIAGELRVKDLLGGVYTGKFYTYNGSLTTPPCAEAVTWNVFSDVVSVPQDRIAQFWNLLDNRGQPLLNNYRQLQNINNRPVLYKSFSLF